MLNRDVFAFEVVVKPLRQRFHTSIILEAALLCFSLLLGFFDSSEIREVLLGGAVVIISVRMSDINRLEVGHRCAGTTLPL